MNSCLYEGTVVHRRYSPVARTFRYRLFLSFLDLAEIEQLFGRRGLWSLRFPAVARFRRDDYLGPTDVPLDEAVRRLVAARTGRRPVGPIRLLTNLRSFGFRMNPVSFYFCYDPAGRYVETLVAEVTNTPWGERHAYVVEYPHRREPNSGETNLAENYPDADRDSRLSPKRLHVSPFLTMNMGYRWNLSEPGERLTIGIENMAPTGKPFEATLALRRRPLTRAARWGMLLKYPLLTWRIGAAIYWQALLIWWRGVPFVAHPGPHGVREEAPPTSRAGRTSAVDNNLVVAGRTESGPQNRQLEE